jgi:hypothetical protein
VDVRATRRTRRHIEGQGGHVFIWFTPLGHGLIEHVATSCPEGVAFSDYAADGFTVHLPEEFDPPERLELTRLVWPLGWEVKGTGSGQVVGYSGGRAGWPAHHSGGEGGGGGGGHHHHGGN